MALTIDELREAADLAQKIGDEKLEIELRQELASKLSPSMSAGHGNKSTPIPLNQEGLMYGDNRPATLKEKMFNSSLQAPFDLGDLATFGGATVGAAVAPQLALPSFLSKTAPLLSKLPQVAGAGLGGGSVAAGDAAIGGKNFEDSIRAGLDTGKEFAAAEALGLGGSAAIGKVFEKILGKSTGADDALAFAKERDFPLPLSVVKNGMGAAAEKATGFTMFGNLLRERSANKINKAIESYSQAITPMAKSPDVIAPRAQSILKSVLTGAEDSKNLAFQQLESAVGKDTIIDISPVAEAISGALREAASQGKNIVGPLKELKAFSEFFGDRSFGSLERFRKDTVTKITGNYRTKEIGQPVADAIENVYRQLGEKSGVDVNKSIWDANKLVKELAALKNIPGLTRFAEDVKNPEAWIGGFVNENNIKALNILKEKAPQEYRSLVEQRLAMSFFDKNNTWNPKGFSVFVDKNPGFIKEAYGEETAKVLKNFSSYIEKTSDFTKAASNNTLKNMLMGGAISGATGFKFGPEVGALAEGGGAALAVLLTRPNNPIYKVFSESDPIKISKSLQELTPFVTRGAVMGMNGGDQ